MADKNPLGACLKGLTLRGSDFVGLGWGPETCIFLQVLLEILMHLGEKHTPPLLSQWVSMTLTFPMLGT